MVATAIPPYVVSGQPIASTWGNAVVDFLVRRDQWFHLVAPPLGGSWPAPNDGTTEWMGNNIQAPPWANRVWLYTNVACIRPQGGSAYLWSLYTKISGSGITTQSGSVVTFSCATTNMPTQISYSDYFAVAPGQVFRASMVSGTSGAGLNADPGTTLRWSAHFTV